MVAGGVEVGGGVGLSTRGVYSELARSTKG